MKAVWQERASAASGWGGLPSGGFKIERICSS